MTPTASALTNEQIPLTEHTLDSLYAPVAEELKLTQSLYRETILATAERNYIHELLLGEDGAFLPEAFRVGTADQIAQHLLMGEGKWIRAVITLLCGGACGVQNLRVRQVAVAVELVHLATLIHDDVIDQAQMRRGIESVAGGWGNSVSVLLGDFLFSKAFKLLLQSESVPAQKMLTHATGQMCLGEIKQLRFATNARITEQDYLEMIENKTASLMASAAASGGNFGDLREEDVERFHGYGHALGMAFQITDDVLDYTSATDVLGKEQCGDLRNGKMTLPLIHLYEHDPSVRHIVTGDAPIEEKTGKLLDSMKAYGSFEYAYQVGQRFGERAKSILDELKMEIADSDALTSLYNLVDFVLARKR